MLRVFLRSGQPRDARIEDEGMMGVFRSGLRTCRVYGSKFQKKNWQQIAQRVTRTLVARVPGLTTLTILSAMPEPLDLARSMTCSLSLSVLITSMDDASSLARTVIPLVAEIEYSEASPTQDPAVNVAVISPLL